MAYRKIHDTARRIRQLVLHHCLENNGGYLSQACSAAEIFASLYLQLMKLGPSVAPATPPSFGGVPARGQGRHYTGAHFNGAVGPQWDRFFLSPSHYSLVEYVALVVLGRMAAEGLRQFNHDGSTVEMIGAEHSPGMEVMGGSLGQCLSQAAGVAWARKRKGHAGKNWVFMSDGEFQVGQTWEALQVLSFHQIDNLAVVVDVNGQQCDGPTAETMRIEPLGSRIAAFGATVVEVDGHDVGAIVTAATTQHPGAPLVVLCYTDPCRDISLLQRRRPKLHYLRFSGDEERQEYRDFLRTWEDASC